MMVASFLVCLILIPHRLMNLSIAISVADPDSSGNRLAEELTTKLLMKSF